MNYSRMDQPFSLGKLSSIAGLNDLAELFKPTVKGQYVNQVVFDAPVCTNETAMIRAIEALRINDIPLQIKSDHLA